ncbi:hypothetical protein [Dyella sp. EPa41]|uniref:hypothetical protein n=1 Tax=Dyella sp. EPa41 TaxID=1561194 RepID=UPI0019160051|nr:hypothetical protein [Dyella sp. EPa41]
MKQARGLVFLALGLCGCAATTGNYRPLGERYPARSGHCDVVVFKDGSPDRPYAAISRLNVHLEKTFFVDSDFYSARGELKRQACLSGADAVIDIEEKHSSYLETRIYNLSATGVRFLDNVRTQQ